ncbi:hypothetical protein, partial [Pectobacterium brasiliense]|uniref:hypothetical protein n=1 Tax=Pectobacterium brasiliense TaxID=180957 RepID=UPI0019696159
VGDRREQSVSHRTGPRCSTSSPKVTELEFAEGQCRKAIQITKGRIADWIGDPDLLHRVILRSTLLDNYKYFFEFLV